MDGFEVCRRIRASDSKIGIIMLTARTQEMDKITGLMTGADDYVTKPFSPAELTARIDALYRRTGGDVPLDTGEISQPPFLLNTRNRTLEKNGQRVKLTQVCLLYTSTSAALASLKQEMQSLAASLPEYPVVMGMFGIGPILGPQLMAEIGDVRRFHSKKALVAFAGIDAPPYQSGQMDIRSRSISKRGSAALRRTLFLVMGGYLQNAPQDEPVYKFMDKKRSEGKPYRVYMMASANKFLRIYYASVTTYLNTLAQT